ncbi:uncharacterized protein BO66DRAFT_417646 [Aspergillus aculeatinus CBS 121060]|uniref:Uncharacterized protein n=1 Tax=Aspergillus aculeatinus CBS 121060 TaxID=1448322 RepID=A0ACD1HJU9_9EURO|nr:hypothetical protein BO66DRAFT_417646 [Aspergillus aculeatinus CBS 121060]RAH73791.1 hypothetical protein BO66DRAFT_417646 [Aspergillus aculeatinus CBS 121060]
MLAATIFIGLACSSLARTSTANLNMSTTTMAQLGCDATCQTYFQAGLAADVEMFGTGFDPGFYSTASNFTGSAAGDLLKFEAIEPNTVNVITGTTAYRFQYTTRDFERHPRPRHRIDRDSIYFVPTQCKFSRGRLCILHHCWSLLIENGYAVVAPDYAGLGNNTTLHQYLSLPAHANNLYYAMVAARKALPHTFISEWMSVGHSQGGGAVWKLLESELVKTYGAGEPLGTVALAPVSRIYDMTVLTAEAVLTASNYASYDITYEALWLPLALKRVTPGIDLSIVSNTFLQCVDIAELAQVCYYSIMPLGYGLRPSEIIRNTSALVNNVPFQAGQDAMAPANGGTLDTPMRIVQGSNDTDILPQISVRSFNASCLSGNEVHMSVYADMDHTDVLKASSPEWLGFIRDRFERKSTSGRCSVVQHASLDRAHLGTEAESSEDTSL